MKYILTACIAVSAILLLNSCGTTQAFVKPAYLNNDVVRLPNEKVTDITLISVSMAEDKGMYETICSQVQSALNRKGISSDMHFYDAKETPAEIARKIRETTKPYYLVIDKINSGYQKDEMNNDFITKQINCMLQKNNGEHIADFTISIDQNASSTKTGKTVANLIIDYLNKKNLI
jgi:hypothetical protein